MKTPSHYRRYAFILGLLVSVLMAFPALANTRAGQIMFVHGEARIERGDETLTAERGMPFFAGDTFRTSAASTLQLRFTDGGTQAIRPESTFTLDAYALEEDDPEASTKQGSLVRGGLRAITGAIGDRTPENVSYETPVATMGIRGTSFQILHFLEDATQNAPAAGTGSYLYVEDGILEMTSDGGGRLVRPGQVFYTPSPDVQPGLVPDGVQIFENLDESIPPANSSGSETAPVTDAEEGDVQATDNVQSTVDTNNNETISNFGLATAGTEQANSEDVTDETIDDLDIAEETTDASAPPNALIFEDPSNVRFIEISEQPQGLDGVQIDAEDIEEVSWGLWQEETSITTASGARETLPEESFGIAAFGDITDENIRKTLSDDFINAGESLTFRWSGGRNLLSPTGDSVEITDGFIEIGKMTETSDVKVSLLFENSYKLSGTADPANGFNIEEIELTDSNILCNTEGCVGGAILDEGVIKSRYIGRNAEAIMSLIKASGVGTDSYTGAGVFEETDNETLTEGSINLEPEG